MAITTSPASGRPTLPSLHTLNLPGSSGSSASSSRSPAVEYFHSLHDTERKSRPLPIHAPQPFVPIPRSVSISSSTTSRSPSPSPSYAQPPSARKRSLVSLPRVSVSSEFPNVRLQATTLEDADAIVVVPPPGCGESLLLVGHWPERIRRLNGPIAKGARMHPYRMIRLPPGYRRQPPSATKTKIHSE